MNFVVAGGVDVEHIPSGRGSDDEMHDEGTEQSHGSPQQILQSECFLVFREEVEIDLSRLLDALKVLLLPVQQQKQFLVLCHSHLVCSDLHFPMNTYLSMRIPLCHRVCG